MICIPDDMLPLKRRLGSLSTNSCPLYPAAVAASPAPSIYSVTLYCRCCLSRPVASEVRQMVGGLPLTRGVARQ